MKIQSFSKSVAAVALCLAAAWAAPAQAAVYAGSWDPLFGSPFTIGDGYALNLGWRGEARFNVPDTCLPVGTGYQIVDAGACGATTLSGLVELFDVDAVGQPTLEQLDWGGLSGNAVGSLLNLLYLNGDLVGFDTAEFASIGSAFEYVAGGFGNGPLAFSLVMSADPQTFNGPQLNWVWNGCGDCAEGGSTNANITDFKVAVVPEPGSLALVALALLGAGWGRRRAARNRRD